MRNILLILLLVLFGCETMRYSGNINAKIDEKNMEQIEQAWLKKREYKKINPLVPPQNCAYYSTHLPKANIDIRVDSCYREDNYHISACCVDSKNSLQRQEVDALLEEIKLAIENDFEVKVSTNSYLKNN